MLEQLSKLLCHLGVNLLPCYLLLDEPLLHSVSLVLFDVPKGVKFLFEKQRPVQLDPFQDLEQALINLGALLIKLLIVIVRFLLHLPLLSSLLFLIRLLCVVRFHLS